MVLANMSRALLNFQGNLARLIREGQREGLSKRDIQQCITEQLTSMKKNEKGYKIKK
jgi:hypothetical protein